MGLAGANSSTTWARQDTQYAGGMFKLFFLGYIVSYRFTTILRRVCVPIDFKLCIV